MSSNEQKNNKIKSKNLENYFAEPKPGLVFITTLIILNYKFWIIVFSELSAGWKIYFIEKNFSILYLIFKIVIACLIAIAYPFVIKGLQYFYYKYINKIPTTANEVHLMEIDELKKAHQIEIEKKDKEIQTIKDKSYMEDNLATKYQRKFNELIRGINSDLDIKDALIFAKVIPVNITGKNYWEKFTMMDVIFFITRSHNYSDTEYRTAHILGTLLTNDIPNSADVNNVLDLYNVDKLSRKNENEIEGYLKNNFIENDMPFMINFVLFQNNKKSIILELILKLSYENIARFYQKITGCTDIYLLAEQYFTKRFWFFCVMLDEEKNTLNLQGKLILEKALEINDIKIEEIEDEKVKNNLQDILKK